MKGQKGFSVVVLLLSILVVTAVGFTAYYVWNTQNNKKEESVVVEPTAEVKSENVNNDTKTPDTQKYLVIKEWGVKIPISDKFADLNYRFNSTEDTVTLSTKTLANYQQQLTAGQGVNGDFGGIGLLSRNDKVYKLNPGEAIPNDGPFMGYFVGSVNGKSFVVIPPSQPSCPESANTSLSQTCSTYEQDINKQLNTLVKVVSSN